MARALRSPVHGPPGAGGAIPGVDISAHAWGNGVSDRSDPARGANGTDGVVSGTGEIYVGAIDDQPFTNAGLIESHPHDVIITKEAPNYQLSQR